jgi:hypothetical protein
MKNIIISAAFLLVVMATASGQTGLMATSLTNAVMSGSGAERSVLKDRTILFAWNEDGAHYKAFFTRGGVWLNTVISYEEGGLPATVKDLIRSRYADLRISFVDEVQTPGQEPVYRVQLQDEKRLVIVKVAGEEMEKEAEYRK